MSLHPSTFILEELAARNWSRGMLALAMEPHMREMKPGAVRLMVDMYLDVGPEDSRLRLGAEMDRGLSGAFGVSPGMFARLERAWLVDEGVTP